VTADAADTMYILFSILRKNRQDIAKPLDCKELTTYNVTAPIYIYRDNKVTVYTRNTTQKTAKHITY